MTGNEKHELLSSSSVSVVVPVYNSEATLAELAERIGLALTPLVDRFEIIFVNDGSRDRSWQVITDLSRSNKQVRGMTLMHNYGQHNALLAGIQNARYDFIVTIDDDLQNPPEEIPNLLAKLVEGYDVVYGKPRVRQHSAARNFSSRMLKGILKVVLGAEMGGHSSAFRAFRSILMKGFQNFNDPQLSIDVLLSWSVAGVTNIPVDHQPRKVGRSSYSLTKLMLLAFNMLTGYSTLPLRIASALGLVTSFMGFLMFVYVIVRRIIQTRYVPGFAFMAAEIALFAGLQLFAIGIIGEYLARMHFRTMGKPPYVIREQTPKLAISDATGAEGNDN
ncbi:MAG: glycosyltransferase family 2 protein [Thermodesulfobacteriota bacterium]